MISEVIHLYLAIIKHKYPIRQSSRLDTSLIKFLFQIVARVYERFRNKNY